MPAILRLVDDNLWDPSFPHWTKLISNVVPLDLELDSHAGHYSLTLSKGNYGSATGHLEAWALLRERENKSIPVPVRWAVGGYSNGEFVTRKSAWSHLFSGRSVQLTESAMIPEVATVSVGDPPFLEIQLLTGRPVPWIREGTGPAEDQVFGGEWDVLCLDMKGPTGPDFHERWTEWHKKSGLLQAFRTVVLYSSSAENVPAALGDLSLNGEALKALERFPAQTSPVLVSCRETLAWRASDRSQEDPIVLPSTEEWNSQWKSLRAAAELAGGIFIEGASGTGKTATARLIHRWSGRTPARFVHANCGELKGDLVKSELFGHVKGAFTGADSAKLGLLTLANSGTLFLDEIHTLKEEAGDLLMKVLDRGRFLPVGSIRELASDFRVICASNDKAASEANVKFDLRNRLFHTTVRLPGIAEYQEEDFRRMVSVCWERLKDEVVRDFQSDDVPVLPSKITLEFDAKLAEYDEQVPAAHILASARALNRFPRLELGEESIRYLLEHRQELVTSNVRGLVAWLRRALLQCPPDQEVITEVIVAQCSPAAIGLVEHLSGDQYDKISSPAGLAQHLSARIKASGGDRVEFGDLCNAVQKALVALSDHGSLTIDGDKNDFLTEAFTELRSILDRRKIILFVESRKNRKHESPFHIPSWGFKKLLECALPALR